jgi:hypothetical protein
MTRTRTSVLLTALLVVASLTAGVSVGASTNQAQDDDVADAVVQSGEVYWQGQFLQFSAGEANASNVWSVRQVEDGEVGNLVTELLLDGTGSAVFATTNLDGQYVVVNADGEPVTFENGEAQTVGSVSEASFEVTPQTLNATFDSATAENAGPDARSDLQLQSNRAGYGFYLFSEQLSASELADVFQNVEVRDGEAVATRNASDDDVFEANFSGVEPGTYDVTVVPADGVARDTATITVSEPVEGTAGLANATVIEQRGDVARFNVTFDGVERARVQLGSREVSYLSRFTVVDADGDGEATVEVNTFRAGLSENASGVSVVGEDEMGDDFRMVTEPISGPLDAATYPIVVSVGATRTAVGSLTLNERSTEGVQIWTAPDRANVSSVSRLTEVAAQDDTIGFQDWAIVQIETSGLSGYVQNLSDLNNESTGLSMTLTNLGGQNVQPTEVSLDQGEFFVDETGDRYFLVLDSNALEQGVPYEANFTVSGANPYVEAGNGTSYVTNFTVVERNASFDEPVEVPASSDATISGSSTAAPGTELTIEASNTADAPFLKRGTATVEEDGAWEVSLDFSNVAEGTNFTVTIDDPEANATGTVVAAEGQAGAQAETTTPEETTTAPETTPADEGEASDEGDEDDEAEDGAADADEETTPEEEAGADEEETTEETTTEETTTTTTTTTEEEEQANQDDEAGTAPAPGFGPVSVLLAVVALLAAGLLAVRRR